MITRGRSGTSDLMNWPDEVNVLASEFVMLLPFNCSVQLSLATPIDAS